MTNKHIEEIVVKLTRLAHPEDLGEPTSKLEDGIRLTLTTALEERDKEIIHLMQHQARNVLKSAEAVAQWGDLYLLSKREIDI